MNVERINNRFKELMARDPLVLKYLNEFNEYMDRNPALKEGSHILDPPKAVKKLGVKVFKKWNSPLLEGINNSEYFMVQKILPPIGKLAAWKQVVNSPNFPEHPLQAYAFFKNPGHLYIDINCSVLDKNDAKYVKSAVWELVRLLIESKQVSVKGQEKNRIPTSPPDDPPELAPFYHMREDVFRNYLRWYDIHTKEKLGFRLMAVVESIRQKNISGAEELLKRFIHARVKWGSPVKGEDRIEKGVKLIHEAIHRKPYAQKEIESIIEEYNCPQHGNNCKPTCIYYKAWLGRFNRLNKIA